ncbi:HBL/NHE enterotoxin family protein [Pseudomonas lalucatii]|uniref:HBL/NHE enterotoxin family protein n=1 Tax=Pseudomonas lalucatii TaxID=1424203 RepID=A0ABS5Q6D9_9PSED|nr:HBL/NHE enterotoxin family protein [Pseudomonas lalucatii]MBS7664302.1 HBL/NHE enterotoxin family protein [Pseudomonas lalucatii]MBS7725541.1 HBL/NHE enterotoxin family protein [Pseudomonas lalucatii]QVM86516.1 HBL/NHE enterotoxin family protein [Pseudomonas lalucatii]
MLSLARAISSNARSLAEAQASYKQNVVEVNTLMTSVLTSSLPTLNQNPPDWNEFITAYEQANGDALNWVNNVMARLLDVPQEVIGYNGVISQVLQDAKTQAQTLIDQPSNPTALATLNQDLNALTSQLALVTSFIAGAVSALQQSRDSLPDMARQLQSIADRSTQDANADQAQIDQLNADIARLKADIKSLTAAIVALGIADGVAITLGVAATIALWPVGAAVWFVLGPAVAVASTYIALDAEKIKADQASIQAKLGQITGITADVATLHVLAGNFADLASQSEVIETSLQAILAEWQTLESDVNAAVSDIRSALADAGGSNFTAVLDDLNEAIDEWNAAYVQAGSLQLDLQVNTAQLEYGMSSAQVQASLASGQNLGLIDYYNNVSSQARKVA